MILEDRDIMQDVANGVDFMLAILPTGKEFPRNILVSSYHEPYAVWNRDDILYRYKAVLYEDCYLNAFPNNSITKPLSNHLMIDIDRKDFVDEQAFDKTVAEIKTNIAEYITGSTGEHPIIIDSGNGYHMHVPMPGITQSFEDIPEFTQFRTDKPSELDVKFLRYLERKLTGGKSDHRHSPSVNSLMFRIPGSINTRARNNGRKDPYVRVVEGYEYVPNNSRPTDDLLNDFYAYLVQQRIENSIDQSERNRRKLLQSLNPNSAANQGNSIISWIEKLLSVGVEDQRKDLLFWVLAPYLVSVRQLDFDNACEVLYEWLAKCHDVRRLEPTMSAFKVRAHHCLQYCMNAEKPRLPIKFQTFKEQYPDLYKDLFGSNW